MNPAQPFRPRVIALVAAIAIAALGVVALPIPGLYLVVADRLERSDAIFVLDGGTPSREIEAAALYHRGFAPLVVLTLSRDPLSREVHQLSGTLSPQDEAARILAHARVPSRAIVRLQKMVENTEQELQADDDFARSRGLRRVILVTAPYHTRRVRIMWNRTYDRTLPAIVHPTPWERFVPERWWMSRRYLEMTVHEIFGMLNFYLGSPIKTFDREG